MTSQNISTDQLDELLNLLEANFESYSPDEAIDKAVEALHLSVVHSDGMHLGRARFLLGIGLRRILKFDESIAELNEALEAFDSCLPSDGNDQTISSTHATGHSAELNCWERHVRCLHELGNTYYHKQDFPLAERYYGQVIELAVGHDSLQMVRGKALVFLASTYYYLGNFTKSRVTFFKALSVVSELNDPKVLIDIYVGMGWMDFEMQQLDEAIEETERAKAVSEEIGGYRLSNILHNLGAMYMAQGRLDEAYDTWQYCMSDYQAKGNVRHQVSLYEELAAYWVTLNRLDEAEKCCEEAVKLLNTQENLVLRGRIYRFLGDIHDLRGNTVFAREYYRISLGAHNVVGAHHEIAVTQDKLEKLDDPAFLEGDN